MLAGQESTLVHTLQGSDKGRRCARTKVGWQVSYSFLTPAAFALVGVLSAFAYRLQALSGLLVVAIRRAKGGQSACGRACFSHCVGSCAHALLNQRAPVVRESQWSGATGCPSSQSPGRAAAHSRLSTDYLSHPLPSLVLLHKVWPLQRPV